MFINIFLKWSPKKESHWSDMFKKVSGTLTSIIFWLLLCEISQNVQSVSTVYITLMTLMLSRRNFLRTCTQFVRKIQWVLSYELFVRNRIWLKKTQKLLENRVIWKKILKISRQYVFSLRETQYILIQYILGKGKWEKREQVALRLPKIILTRSKFTSG